MKFPNPLRFVAAMWRAFRSPKPVQVDDRTREERKRICEACPQYDELFSQCNRCGCFVPLKIELLTESCPDGRWKRG